MLSFCNYFCNLFSSIYKQSSDAAEDAITVDKVSVGPLQFEDDGKECSIRGINRVRVSGIRSTRKNGKPRMFDLVCTFKDGFVSRTATTDSHESRTFNIASFIREALYMCRGNVSGTRLTREECDEIARGIWKYSGSAVNTDIFFKNPGPVWGKDQNNCMHCFEGRFEYR